MLPLSLIHAEAARLAQTHNTLFLFVSRTNTPPFILLPFAHTHSLTLSHTHTHPNYHFHFLKKSFDFRPGDPEAD